ncbi:MAG: phosphatase PAP2 family protein [Candidatus Kapaibacterium sp.]|nr:MAG: phosphatase PAP2 family protein [Candidatus Kapabacteria bacterium]
MDIYFFQLTNQFVAQSADLFFFAVDSAEDSWELAALTLIGLWFSGISTYSQQTYIGSLSEHGKQQRYIRGRVLVLFAVMVAGFVAARVLQHFFEQPRPMTASPMLIPFDPAIWTRMKVHISEQGSFPSDHAVMWFTVAMGTFLLHRIAGIIGLVIAAILCFFRMGTGYHWASDILAGTALGVGFTLLAFYVLNRNTFLQTLLYYVVDIFEQYPVPMYVLGFLIISDFAVKFSGLFGLLKSMLKVSVAH